MAEGLTSPARSNGKLLTPFAGNGGNSTKKMSFTGKAGKTKSLGGPKQKWQQQYWRPKPLWQSFFPLFASGASLQCLLFFSVTRPPREDRALFALLCFMGGVVSVEACQRMVVAFGDVHPLVDAAVSHFRGNASGYMASFVVVVILQGVWSETQEDKEATGEPNPFRPALSCVAVLSVAICLHLIAPRFGGFLLHQLDDVRSARLLRSSSDRRCARSGWKTAKECFATSVVFGLCITAAVLSGGGAVLMGLGMTHSVVSATREAIPVIRKGWLRRKMSQRGKGAAADAPAAAQDYCSLQGVIMLIRSGPTQVVCSPVILPAFLLWMTHSTICSWPKECTDRLALLLKVLATTVCTTHLIMRPPAPEADAPPPRQGAGGVGGGGGGRKSAISWPRKVLVCVCSLTAWTLLLMCSLVVLGHQESPEGILVAFLVVTLVALRTPHEKTWRGLMLVFWAALLAVLVNVACSKLMQQNKVFHRVFSDRDRGGGSAKPSYLGVFRAVTQLREDGRVAMWSVCPSPVVEKAERPWFRFSSV